MGRFLVDLRQRPTQTADYVSIDCYCHVAFGNRIAKVDTTPLNRRATDASALPIANITLVYAGDPLCRMRGIKVRLIRLIFLDTNVFLDGFCRDGGGRLCSVILLYACSGRTNRPPCFTARHRHHRP